MKVLALACLVAACGNSHQNVDALVVLIDAPADARPDAPPDAPSAKFGQIEVSQGTGNGSAAATATAQFGITLYGTVTSTDGPCDVYALGGTQAHFSAGAISITGTASPITLTPTGTAPSVHYSPSATVPDPVFTAGATIAVSAAGGADVPAFSGSVTAPAALAGYTPPATSISRSGYAATWTAATGPTIWVIMAGYNLMSGNGNLVVCRVNDTGSFTIPASTFAKLPADADHAFVGIGRIAPTTVNAGAVMVTIQATSYITSGNLTLTP